mmetsp:Transcript_85728/g.242392  ORF Transcript_85728/g.242392 Transcript_85728/m.242392 type:complete len:93 (+) Transcript_85728:645-923(+)
MLECPEEVMEQRLLKRGETSGRSDDNIESIRKRFKTYKESTMPVVQVFAKENKVREVVSDRAPEEVYADVRTAICEVTEPLEQAARKDSSAV